jgi:hypothetical protein
MADEPHDPKGKEPPADERRARVAAALRANLRRRKAAARKAKPKKSAD